MLRAPQPGGEQVRRHRLEVAERLVEVDGQAEVRRPAAHVLGTHVAAEKIVLEDLDPAASDPLSDTVAIDLRIPRPL
ncbi:hypothetical protein GCM10023178_56180 [Actinomadura luteofluorescens]